MTRRAFLAGTSAIVAYAMVKSVHGDSPGSAWGDLKGRFVYDGEPPERVRLEITKDVAYVKEPLFDESLLVDKKSRGLANVVVTLQPGKAGDVPPIHPSYNTAKLPPVETTFRGLRIEPHVTVVRTGQEFVYVDADPVGHNPRFELRNNQSPAVLVSRARETISTGYRAAEATPASISCSVHPWESAVLVVTDHPYVGVSETDGSFVIKDLPVGRWTFCLWHERCQGITEATISGTKQKLDRGKLAIETKPGENNLHKISIEPRLLDRGR